MVSRLSPAIFGILVAAALSSCAHYGLSNRTGGDVSVETVAVEGDSGLDPSALTRTMVDRLRRQGITASWGGDATNASCSVSIVGEGAAGGSWSPSARAVCTVETRQYEAFGRASATLEAPSNDSIRTVQQTAATQAIVAAADRIAADLIGKEESDGQEE